MDDMILQKENLKDAMKKMLEPINEFTKVAGYKIKIKNLFCFYILTTNYKEKVFKSNLQLHQKE